MSHVWKSVGSLTCLWLTAAAFAMDAPGLPATLYEEWRKSPAPADGAVALVNPPSLQWASVKHWEGRAVRYRVELSDDARFPPGRTIRGQPQRPCMFCLATGRCGRRRSDDWRCC